MHRFHLPPEQCHGPTLVLSGGEAHHASRVLRVEPGERVTVLDGAGREFQCEITSAEKRSVHLRVLEKLVHPPRRCQTTLLQAIPKGKIIESIIEKATELGVYRIVPLLTERVTTRLDGDTAAEKAGKWQHVAIEAIKQCGAVWLPEVGAPATVGEFLARGEQFDLALVGALQGEALHPREHLRKLARIFHTFPTERRSVTGFDGSKREKPVTDRRSTLSPVQSACETCGLGREAGAQPLRVAIWIGPEGDFTLAELQAIQSAGAKPITLGNLVLRVETAATYCLSILHYELQSPRD